MKRFIRFSPGKILLATFTLFGALAATQAYSQVVPVISNFTPTSGLVGTSLMISGMNFNAIAASNIVHFGAVQANVLLASSNSLTVAVPCGATFGPVTVTVGGLTAYSGQLFEPTFTGNGSNITPSSFAPSFNLPGASGPQSMVIADLDDDGKPDIAFVNGYNNVISIYRNISTNGALLGASSFAPRLDLAPATIGVIGSSYRLRAVDLDGDGRLDLIVCDTDSDHISIFHNISTPGGLMADSFEVPFTLSASYDTRYATAADLDGDGRVDIVALNYGAKTISIYKNIGTPGTLTTNSFAPPIVLAAPGGPYEAVIADLDGDGKPDLAVANADNNTVSIFQNQAVAGTLDTNSFAARVDLPGGASPETITAVDLDGDGKLDLVTGSVQSDNVNVYRNLSTGGLLTTNSFAPEVDFGTPGWMHTVSVADFNGDGKPDLGVCGELNSYMAIFQNNSTPGSFTTNSFAPRVDFSTGWNAWGIAAGDLDGDGRPDIVFGNFYDNTVQIYQNQVPFGTPPSCTPAPSGLVGWWRGEGNANDSAGTNNGSLSGSGATYATGEVGQGFRFDGTNGYVQIPDSDALKPANVTVEAWIWLDPSLPSQNGGEQIVFKKNTWSAWFEGYSLLKTTIDNGDGTYSDRFQFCVSRSGNQVAINSQTIAQRGVWHHVAATYDGNQSKLYVNGVLEASATPGFALDYDTTPIFIGTSGTWTPYLSMFGGIIDEVSIYNRALTSNEIGAIYNAGSAGKCSNSTAPFITSQPVDRTVTVSNQATFTVTAGGTPPLSYQWRFDGTNILGATNSSLNLTAQNEIQGTYDVVISNALGVVTSFSRQLLVSPGQVAAWGWNAYGQTIVPPGISNIVSVSGGELHSLALRSDGTVYAWGAVGASNAAQGSLDFGQATVPSGLSNIVAIAAGGYHNLALRNDGTVAAWGAGTNDPNASVNSAFLSCGQNVVPPGLSNVVALAAGLSSSLALKNDGTVVAWGNNSYGQTNVPTGLSNVVSVAAGDYHFLVLKADGTVVAWGGNLLGASSVPAGLSNVVAIAASGNHCLALKSNGTITGWGDSAYGVTAPPAVTNPIAVALSFDAGAAIKNDGTVAVWGSDQFGEQDIQPGLANVTAIACGASHELALALLPSAPAIVSQTGNEIVLLGSSATLSVTASGSNPLSYFWSRNDVLIPGATNSFYILANAQLSDSGSRFSCLVTNAYGTAASTNVSLKVIDTVSNDLCSGAVVIASASYTNVQSTLKASAFGDPVPGCINGFGHGVWYQFTAPVAGQLVVDTFGSDFDTGLAIYTGSCDALTEVACNDDTGGVTSQVILPTAAGTTYFILAGGYDSDAGNLVLHLNHLTPPAFAVQPTNQSVVVSNTASFSTTLTGALPMSFQWYFDGNPLADDGRITGSLSANLIISNITTFDAGSYTLAVTNFLGATNSAAAVLTVLTPPTIVTQPIGRSVPPGLPTTFSVVATGNPTPSYYQWQLNGTNIPGATSSSYNIAAVGTNDLGFYQVVASNPLGVATSVVAQLTFGPVAAWGRNLSNESLPPPDLNNVIAIAGTFGASYAAKADGSIVAWGGGTATNIPAGATNVVSLAASGSTAVVALRADGTVVGWNNSSVPALSNIVAVASGWNSGVALRAEGTIIPWGNPNIPAGLTKIKAVAYGYTHGLALRSDGTVAAWGAGAGINVPGGLFNVTAIAAGYNYSLALKSDGRVVAWGSGINTNLPASLTNVAAIAASSYSTGQGLSLAISSNGTVVVWGDNSFGQTNPPAALSNLVSVALGSAIYHVLALVNDGSPQILHPPVGLTAYTGRDVTLQASAVGAAPLSYQWLFNGTNIPGATNASLFIPNIQFANAGSYQLFVSNSINTAISLPAPVNVISNNTLVFLSQTTNSVTNYQGSKITAGGVTVLGSGPLRYQWFSSPTNKNYVAVSGATNDTLVLDPALAVQSGNYYLSVSNLVAGITSAPVNVKVLFARAWGFQAVSNPPVNVTNAIAVATGGYQNYYGDYFALGADGKLTSWANYTPIYGETNVSALSNSFVTAIAAGTQHTLALKSDGTVYAWGYGGYGQTNPPAGLNSVVAIACGGYHDLALKSDGTVVGWGDTLQAPVYGQATNNPAATNVVAIAAGNLHSLALRADGTVVGWGYGSDGAIAIPPTATSVIAIAAGSGFSAALRANGTVVQWGSGLVNYPVPSNLSNVVAISGSATHCTALRNDGTVVSWGYEYTGNASNNVPTNLANVIAIASGGDHDIGLFGTRAPAFTVQPWNRSFASTARTNIVLAAKCAGVQPVFYQWQLNGTNVPGATNDVFILTNQPSLQFGPVHFIPTGAYQLIASNAYGVVGSKFAKITTFIPLGVALNASNLNWTTTGNAQWFGETNITHDGVSAAQSGGIGALQETILQTTLATNYPGNVTFWWKVSSEQFFDILEFRVNGVSQTNISGEAGWQQVSIPVAAGTNILQWRYSKDASFDGGQDAGWVDQFAFVPAPPAAPVILLQPASQTLNMGGYVELYVVANGTIQNYQWRQNGNAIGCNCNFQVLNNVGRAQSGTYTVTVTGPGGSTVSSNAVVKVLVPQVLASPQVLPNGTFQLLSADANGGLLSPSDLANFEAQASTDLVNWVILTNALSLTNGMLQLQDNSGTNWPTRFYRILEH